MNMEHERLSAPVERSRTPKRGQMDMPFFLLTMLLVSVGLIMMFSASYARAFQEVGNSAHYLVRQGAFALVGTAVMLFVSILDYQIFRRWSFLILLGSWLLLLLVLVIGVSGGGSTRWLNLGLFTIQPSEFVKLGVVIAFSAMISGLKEKMHTFKYGVLPFGIILLLVAIPLLLQPHLSATVIICLTGAAMMFLGGTKLRWFVLLILLGGGAFAFLTKSGYTADRITAWKDPWSDPSDGGYQIIQSLYAIGSGGLFGLGFGKSRQKYLYLPEEHNDYIFPIVCEELGFVGATLVILLYVLLILRGYWIAMHAKDRFGSLMAGGLTTLLALQVFLNIGVVTNFLPSTGISLPFFSYGGTALVLQLVQMGLILSVSRYSDNNLL